MSFLPVYESLADKVRHIYLTYDENNRITPHFHNSMEIVFVNRGDFHVIISGEEKTLHEGEIAVSDSYDVHNYIQIGDAAVYIAVIAQQFLRDFREANDKTFERFLFLDLPDFARLLQEDGLSCLKSYGQTNHLLFHK